MPFTKSQSPEGRKPAPEESSTKFWIKIALFSLPIAVVALLFVMAGASGGGQAAGPLIMIAIPFMMLAVPCTIALAVMLLMRFVRLPGRDYAIKGKESEVLPSVDIPWIETVFNALKAENLSDYYSAVKYHNSLSGSAGGAPPFQGKYEEVFLKLQARSPYKTVTDWNAANEQIYHMVCFAKKNPAAVPDGLKKQYPGFSEGFYQWMSEVSRRFM